MLDSEYKPQFWKQPGWEHKDASDIVAGQSIQKTKYLGGLLGFLGSVTVLPGAIEKLDKLADLPNPVEAGLFVTGTALLTYGMAKLGEAIARKEYN
jgi:hypothetical protein